MQAGYSQEEAERLAICDFGGEQEIGEELQESQSPHYRLLLVLVGAGSILHFLLLVFPVYFASISSFPYGNWNAT
nr:hypothetical protein [Brevibacillus laterosporus]